MNAYFSQIFYMEFLKNVIILHILFGVFHPQMRHNTQLKHCQKLQEIKFK
jgi:hypothetical protein